MTSTTAKHSSGSDKERGAVTVSQRPHKVRHDGAADDRHDHKGTGALGVFTEVFHPGAKMVGNMIDIKKNTAISATTDTPSTLSITTPHSAMLISA